MKRVVLYVKDKCPHCKDAQRYLDSKTLITAFVTQRCNAVVKSLMHLELALYLY